MRRHRNRRICCGPGVEQALLVELKAINALNEAYHARCINYLKASGPCPGLLLNFDMNWLEIDRVANTV
ncbi:MAG TPA: hypothetical protein DDZ81_09730 [Acetobacteraceae bacterium]|nr:hypothetical protein [Acetobacteraceae bacterium]